MAHGSSAYLSVSGEICTHYAHCRIPCTPGMCMASAPHLPAAKTCSERFPRAVGPEMKGPYLRHAKHGAAQYQTRTSASSIARRPPAFLGDKRMTLAAVRCLSRARRARAGSPGTAVGAELALEALLEIRLGGWRGMAATCRNAAARAMPRSIHKNKQKESDLSAEARTSHPQQAAGFVPALHFESAGDRIATCVEGKPKHTCAACCCAFCEVLRCPPVLTTARPAPNTNKA